MTKRFLFFAIANLIFSLFITAQSIEKQIPPHPAYDSSTNKVDYNNCKQYIGQKLLMLPYSKIYTYNRPIATGAFFLSPNRWHKKDNVFAPKKISTSVYDDYQVPGGAFDTDYKAVAGKYFKVLDVIDQSKYFDFDKGVFFKLQNIETNDVLYYEISKNGNVNDIGCGPWVCNGYYEKFKNFYRNQAFIITTDLNALLGINNGKPVLVTKGEELICKDVTLLETNQGMLTILCIILKDSLGNEVALSPQEGLLMANKEFDLHPLQSGIKLKTRAIKEQKAKQEKETELALEEQYKAEQAQAQADAEQTRENALIKKYGKKIGAKIANGQVELGMTKEMCLAAWGEPGNKRTTASTNGNTNEKWFYGRVAFLYFKGNVLAEMQE